ncbi:MAG: ferredoxin [Acidobacteria bacterium]|nr:ferredoxin [Acidobacteriota bacterium]
MDQERLEIPLFRPYSKLIEITVRGKKVQIPENQILLRAFQYLCPDTIPYGRYCWNEECQYCRVSVRRPGAEKVTQALSCKLMVEEGLDVQELADELKWNLRRLFSPEAEEEPPCAEEPEARSQESEEPEPHA